MNTELYESIIAVFKDTHSVLETARRLNTYPIKVRRVLITEGLWSSKSSREIARMFDSGMKISEIAEELDMTDKNVQAYMPYSKGEYGKPNKSNNAVNTNNYRRRNSAIASRQPEKKDSLLSDAISTSIVRSRKSIMRLYLELNTDEQCYPTLWKYGKVKKTISREILVPSDMTLLALHYAIQRAFGWQEWHLHTFEIDNSVLEKLTDNSFMKWRSFCGLYVRYPLICDEYFWDEDYKGDISYKNWLKKQYTGPYKYGGTLEHLVACRKMVDQFIDEHPALEKVETDENGKKAFAENETTRPQDLSYSDATFGFSSVGLNQLLERLSVGEILFPKGYSIDEEALNKLLSLEWSAADQDPESVPITDSIKYVYWGLGLQIQITCIAQYDIRSGVPDFEDQMGRLQRAPLCINYDGLPLVEDVSDLGFCQFLEALHSDDASERDDTRKWAREMGWTGYMVKPENLL